MMTRSALIAASILLGSGALVNTAPTRPAAGPAPALTRQAAPPSEPDTGILTPAAPHEPRINGPTVYGVRPGHPFLYRIPATGDRPMQFGARNLPPGLTLDTATGIISGVVPNRQARYNVTLAASNGAGRAERALRIVVGNAIALTPPMGWNDWYTFYEHPSDELMRRAADVLVHSGMADHGYQYVNIDDCWMVKPSASDPLARGAARDGRGRINGNGRFPDMKAMTAYIHGLGLKAGIYSSPGGLTCAGYFGSNQHEALDVARFVEWGFDFLKYDWCSYDEVVPKADDPEHERERLMQPYRVMGKLLAEQPRDIVFNLCQYGMGDVWTWGAEVGGQSWRTTGDLGNEKGGRLPGFYAIAFSNAQHADFAGPGRWNDPDYILIGYVGNGDDVNGAPTLTTLTHNEQYSYMSLWVLMAAPLFYSGDITRLDAFTLNVLDNAEVIEVDQDVLGRQGRIVRKTDDECILAKPMEDGSLAVGLFNLSDSSRRVSVALGDLGLAGVQRVRDLWRWREIGTIADAFASEVPRHGVTLVRMWPTR